MAKFLKHLPSGDLYIYTAELATRPDMQEVPDEPVKVETPAPKRKAKAKVVEEPVETTSEPATDVESDDPLAIFGE